MTLKLHNTKGDISKMGLTHVAVTIKKYGSNDTFTADFLVDTGASHSMAPASELKRIGIEPVGTREYELANGEWQEFHYGFADTSFMGERTVTEILFGPDNSEPILGVIALQSVGYLVDPKNERLRKLPALPLKTLKSVAW